MDLLSSPRFPSTVTLLHSPNAPTTSSTTSSPSLHVTVHYSIVLRQFRPDHSTTEFVTTAPEPFSFFLGTLEMLHTRPSQIFQNLGSVLTQLGVLDPAHRQQLGLSLTRQIDELTQDLVPPSPQEIRLLWTVERREDVGGRGLAFIDERMLTMVEEFLEALSALRPQRNNNNNNNNYGMVPTAPEALAKLTAVEVDSVAAGEICSICLDELVAGLTTAAAMPCKHVFHEECIASWLKRSHYCPICRFEMPTAADMAGARQQ